MAQPKTQDTQKVFNSATENFKSFMGSVENVSHTKDMENIYANMTKLFDAFTNGALLEQGANSETLLRTVYRSLDEDFLGIVQDTQAVDKIIEVIKSKQEGIEPEKVDEAMVSETTKKVVTKTLDPETCDPMQVVLDFIDELHTSILQVKLNLSREYERRRLEYAKSLAGQQEDLDRLKAESDEQAKQISETLEQVSTDESEWKDAQLKELSRLMEKFDQATSKASDNILAQTLQKDKNLSEIAKEQKKVDWDKLISGIQGRQQQIEKASESSASTERPMDGARRSEQPSEPSQQGSVNETQQKEGSGKQEQKPREENRPETSEKSKDEVPESRQKVEPQKQEKSQAENPKGDELDSLVPEAQKLGMDMQRVGKLKIKPPTIPPELNQQAQAGAAPASKLNVTPSRNGMCVCPICGHVHPRDGAHVQTPTPSPENKGGETKLTRSGVVGTIEKIHQNLQRKLNDKKFKNAFQIDYAKIQGGLLKQMKKVDGSEQAISKDLSKTKSGISRLKRELALQKGKGILCLLLGGPIGMIAFTFGGGLVLITLARMAISKWKDTYMPKTDGSKMSILGVPVPGWDTIKALGLGVRNFITVGIPTYWDKLKKFMGDTKKTLFGKKGMFKDATEIKYSLIKIFGALIVANTQNAGGWLVKLLFKALSFIPFVGPVFGFLADFGPMIWTFLTTQIMLIWGGKAASVEQEEKMRAANQRATGQAYFAQMKKQLAKNAQRVTPFKGQTNILQGLQTQKRGGKSASLPTRGAIMREVPVHYNKNFEEAEDMQEDKAGKDRDSVEDEVSDRLERGDKGDLLVNLFHATDAFADWVNESVARDNENSWTSEEEKAEDLERGKNLLKKIRKIIRPQLTMLDEYISSLQKSPRFKNVKGPLYDPNTGWNPGYRVFASDLKSIIPLNPFEPLHKKPDIPFGQPADAETDSIGFMPFTWYQDGAKISVNPVIYEINRAYAISQIYRTLWNGQNGLNFRTLSGWVSHFDPEKYSKYWVEWNHALAEHDIWDYPKRENVIYGDKFGKFLERLRAGRIRQEQNSLKEVRETSDSAFSESWSAAFGEGTLSEKLQNGFAAGVVGGPLTIVTGHIGQMAGKKVQGWTKALEYDRKKEGAKGELAYDENAGWWENKKRFFGRIGRKFDVRSIINEWRSKKFSGIEYGDIRDFWLDSGALDLFSGTSIYGTSKVAIPLIEFLIDRNIIAKGPVAKGSSAIHHLMSWFYKLAGIEGYDWKNVLGMETDQAGFAQVFLEYLLYKVLPQWNAVERLLSDDITYRSEETHQKMQDGIRQLASMMASKSIFDFMYRQLRFPNMKVKIVDYSNAKGLQQRMTLDKYRSDMGIPNAKGKDDIIKQWQMLWGEFGTMTDSQLDTLVKTLRGYMAKAEFEARYTGDYTYLKQLTQFWDRLEKEQEARRDQKESGDKIVKTPGSITKVLEPPPKTVSEIEEEKRKAAEEEAKRKMEEERKAKEEREKKLKEEAKRKEALAIANAKIKAMEAIKKQEENYESILQKMIGDPGKVTDAELKSLGDEVNNLKQEAENQIAKLPREERELKLALIRGDKISEKTFSEIKETAIGLHGNLQEYIEEVNQIPVGSVLAIQNSPGMTRSQTVTMQDSDSVDLGDS